MKLDISNFMCRLTVASTSLCGDAENAGVENAGVEEAGVDRTGGICRSGKRRSR